MKTAQEFIDFFRDIPKERWGTGELRSSDGRSCALGHCGVTYILDHSYAYTPDSLALRELLRPIGDVVDINDLAKRYSHFGDNPKDRIINALLYVQDMEKKIHAEEANNKTS